MRGNFAFAAIKLFDHGFLHDLHALLFKSFLGKCADFGVFNRQNAVHDFDNCRVGSQRVVKAREFNPNCARSDHKQLFGHSRRLQCVLISPHQITVGLKPWQLTRPRTGGKDNIGRF